MSGPITPPLTVETIDGATEGRPITTIKVSNGDLTISGGIATIDTSGTATTPGGSDTQVQFNDGGVFGGDNGFTYTKATEKVKVGNASIVTSNAGKVSVVQESADTGAAMYLQKDEDGAGSGPNLVFYRNSASPANDDAIGRLGFNGEDSIGGERTYARITGEIEDVTSGANDGRIVIETIKAGTQTEQIQIDSAGIKFNNAYTFPTADGNANQVLTTDGAGAITFEDGGGSYSPKGAADDDLASAMDVIVLSGLPPYGTGGGYGYDAYFPQNSPSFAPFVATQDGSISALLVNIETAAASAVNLEIGIYSDGGGYPTSRLTLASIDATSTGEKEQTSLTGTATLVAGTQYWIGNCRDAAVNFKTYVMAENVPISGPSTAVVNSSYGGFTLSGGVSDNALPSSVTATDLYEMSLKTNVIVGAKF